MKPHSCSVLYTSNGIYHGLPTEVVMAYYVFPEDEIHWAEYFGYFPIEGLDGGRNYSLLEPTSSWMEDKRILTQTRQLRSKVSPAYEPIWTKLIVDDDCKVVLLLFFVDNRCPYISFN